MYETVSISPRPNAQELRGDASKGNEPQGASDLIKSFRTSVTLHKLVYDDTERGI
jgi:hypothetical protein